MIIMRNVVLLKLMQTKGIGEKALKKVISFMDTNTGYSWMDLINNKSILINEIGIKQNVVEGINENLSEAEYLAHQMEINGVKMLTETDDMYPIRLRHNLKNDCPPILFVKGNLSVADCSAVGFCGSRNVSLKGLTIAKSCASQLVKQNISVVSGYAKGTDLAAHTTALINNGKTIFVLAEGILKYKNKPEVRNFLNQDNHLFVSQFYPLSLWSVGNAMARNRTIIGLSDAMILVESGKRGGTFAAGEESLRQKCPLFVIDFKKPEVSAEANPYFISRGGSPLRGKHGVPNLNMLLSTVGSRKIQNTDGDFSQVTFDDVV